jgi:hypothetical protein
MTVRIPLPADPAVVPWIGRAQLAAQHFRVDPAVWAERMGAPPAAVRVLKSGVPATALDDLGTSGDFALATAAFFTAVANDSAFFSIFNAGPRGFVTPPFHRRVSFASASVAAHLRGEGAAVPQSRLTVDNVQLLPRSVDVLVVATREVIEDITATGQNFFGQLMRSAVAVEVDSFFAAQMLDSDAEIIGLTSMSVAHVLAALQQGLDAIEPTSLSRIFFIGSGDTVRTLATLAGTAGPAFPTVGITGGTLLGRPLYASDGVAGADTLLIVDAGSIVANAGPVGMRSSAQALIQMDSAPTINAATPTAASMQSLFQTNSIALMLSVAVGAEKIRDGAVVSVEGFSEVSA